MGGINASDANANPNEQQIEASKAYDVFNAGGTNDPFEQVIVVVGGAPGATADPAFKTAVGDLVTAAARRPAPRSTAPRPRPSASSPTRSRRRRRPASSPPTGRPSGSSVGSTATSDRVTPLIAPVLPILADARTADPALAIHAISSTFINDDINALISNGLDSTLSLTIPLTFIILLFAFGAIVASIVPLVLAISSLVAAFGILGIYSQVVGPVSPNATQLIVLIGLAVAVDYSLFMITRFRVERRAGRDRAKAIEVSSSTAGRAVFFSGLAVMISLAGLITLGVSLFTSMAIGTISVVFVSVVGSLTFLPATLSILGDRVNLGRPAAWLPRLAAALPLGPVSRWGRSALAWLDERAARQEGQRFLGPPGDRVMAPPGRDDGAVRRGAAAARLAGPAPADRDHRHHRLPRFDRRRCRHQAPQREMAAGDRAPAPGRRHRRGPTRHEGRHRTPQDGRPEDRRPERAGRCHAVTRRQGGTRRVHDGRQPERRRQPGHRPEGADGADAGRLRRASPVSRPTSPAMRRSRSTSPRSTPTASRSSSGSSSACRSC